MRYKRTHAIGSSVDAFLFKSTSFQRIVGGEVGFIAGFFWVVWFGSFGLVLPVLSVSLFQEMTFEKNE